jgi:hypothetical protein
MADLPSLPPESPAEQIRELLAALPDTSPVKSILVKLGSGLGLGAILGATASGTLQATAASLSGAIADWLGSRAQTEYNARIEEVMWRLTEEVDRLRIATQPLLTDDDWAELVISVLPVAARAKTQEKRRLFASLLATAAREQYSAKRDEARFMAQLLDQVEYVHVQALGKLLNMGRSHTLDQFWGYHRETTFERSDFENPNTPNRQDGVVLLRLQALGMITVSDATTRSPQSLNKVARIHDLGIRFYEWVAGVF